MSEQIALQLWTLRTQYERDPLAVLERVAEIGYPAVELVFELTERLGGAATHAALERNGLSACSMHAFFDELDERFEEVLEATQELELPFLVCAWVDDHLRADLGGYERVAERLHELGERSREAGIQLVYHHHDFELRQMGKARGIEVILDRVPDELLKVEVDVYWVHAAGLNPVSFLKDLGQRCVLLHCKDIAPGQPPLAEFEEGAAIHNTEVGNGILDFRSILGAAPYVRWLIVEQDFTAGDPYEAVAQSLRALQGLLDERAPA